MVEGVLGSRDTSAEIHQLMAMVSNLPNSVRAKKLVGHIQDLLASCHYEVNQRGLQQVQACIELSSSLA